MSNRTLARFRAQATIDAFRTKMAEDEPCHGDPLTAAASEDDVVFHGPAIPLDTMTGDGRTIASGAVEWDLDVEAVPLLWDEAEGDHTGAIVGVLDQVAEIDGELRTVGRIFKFPNRDTLLNLIANNAIGWSVALDDIESVTEYREPEVEETEDGGMRVRITREMQVETTTHGRLRHLALVDTSAYPSARPKLGVPPKDYMTGGAIAAAAAVATYPPNHFERWEGGKESTPLQVTKDGRVFGQIAGDGVCFRGAPTCQKYESDPDKDLRNFHTHTVTLDDGEVIRVGALVAGTVHASKNMSLAEQRQHHENTSRVWALVRAWEDDRGRLCVSGSVVPGLDPTFQAQAAAAPVSVEKWPVQGQRGVTLVGAVSVTTAAWPVLT